MAPPEPPEPDDDRDAGAAPPRAIAAEPGVAAPGRPAPALRIARSVAAAAPGELLLLGRRGEVLGPRQVTWIKARAWVTMGALVGGTGLVYGGLFSPAIGAASAAAVAALLGIRLRHWPAFRAAIALASTTRWEEARAALLALDRRPLPRAWRPSLQVTLGAIESLLGDPEAALAHLERAQASLAGSSNANATMTRWRATAVRATALASVARLNEARRERDALAAGIAERAARTRGTRSEYFDLLLQAVDLRLAFEADAPAALPDDDTLHSWARAALARTRFGETLIFLAWAFHRRGDDDMARHLLAEAPARIARPSLHITTPRLHAWSEERRRAWDLT